MKTLTDYLVSMGFKAYRKIYLGKKEIKTQTNYGFKVDYITSFDYTNKITVDYFSTSLKGAVDVRYIKDNIEIVIGLNEKGKPPTLIYPRPKIMINGDEKNNDDAMNICLSKETPEDIFKAMFDKSITFKY